MTASTTASPTIIAISTAGFIFAWLGRWGLPDSAGFLLPGSELGDEATMLGPVPGVSGEATAPLDPDPLLGSLTMPLQLCSGGPQRAVFWENADSGKAERDLGISPSRWLSETLNS